MRWIIVLVGISLAGTVAAQPSPDKETHTDRGDAKELVQLGVKLLKSKDYLGALAVFRDAYQRFPSAKILINLGTTLKLLERNAEAANTYQRYLDAPDAEPERRAVISNEIAQLDEHLGRLAITAPDETALQVGDGDWMPAAQGRLYRVAGGSFTLRARRAGFAVYTRSGEVAVGQLLPIVVTLTPLPKVEPPPVPHEHAIVDGEPSGRFAALALGHLDLKGGIAGFLGARFDATERVQLQAAGILGPNLGGYLGAQIAILTGRTRPIVGVGMPLFFNAGPRVAARLDVGVELVLNRHVSLVVELGVEHNFNPQDAVQIGGMTYAIKTNAFIPALGVSARL